MAIDVLLCLGGFALLWLGAGWLVRGAGSLARQLGVRPVVIGLTIVAFGTSAPELVVSVVSAAQGRSMIAVGNVIGSNIANLALVLGICALFRPVTAHRSVPRREIPVMLGVSVLLLLFCVDGGLSRIEGAILFLGILVYTFSHYTLARREAETAREAMEEAAQIDRVGSLPLEILFLAAGIAGVVGGAELVVGAAERIMFALGVSEKFVGLTIVAFGTSLPELATSVVAAAKGEMDISLGNLVGSNVFNILSVLGAAALVRPLAIPGGFLGSGIAVDFGVMIGVSALPLLLMGRDRTIGRRGGAVLILTYGAYLAWLLVKR